MHPITRSRKVTVYSIARLRPLSLCSNLAHDGRVCEERGEIRRIWIRVSREDIVHIEVASEGRKDVVVAEALCGGASACGTGVVTSLDLDTYNRVNHTMRERNQSSVYLVLTSSHFIERSVAT